MLLNIFKKMFFNYLPCAILILMVVSVSYADDFETPHKVKPGDVISADIINELFYNIELSQRHVDYEDLIGTWSATLVINPSWSYEFAEEYRNKVEWGPDEIFYIRHNIITFTSDGDGTYSWSSDVPDAFNDAIHDYEVGSPNIKFENPEEGHGEFALMFNKLDIIYYHRNVDPIRRRQQHYSIHRQSPSRILLTSDIKQIVLDKMDKVPGNPLHLSAEASGFFILLNWEDHSVNETGFKIMRKDCLTCDYENIATTPLNSEQFEDEIIEEGTYWYRVKSTNIIGDSLGSNLVKVSVSD